VFAPKEEANDTENEDPVADKLVHPNAPKLESARDSASHPLTPELSGSGRPQPKVLEVAFSTKYR